MQFYAKIIFPLILLIIFQFDHHFVNAAIRACFFDSNAALRQGSAKFIFAEHYPPGLCTHLIVEKFGIKSDTFELTGMNTTHRMDAIAQCKQFRNRQNPPLKCLISVGGYHISAFTDGFQQMIGNGENRGKFIKNVLKFVRENDLDGVDIHWQYWVTRGNRIMDVHNLMNLFREFRQQNFLDQNQNNSNNGSSSSENTSSSFLLTATVAGNVNWVTFYRRRFSLDCNVLCTKTPQPFREFLTLLDYVWLLTHDFHGNWDGQTAFHASLHNYEDPMKELGNWHLNLEYTIKYWLGGEKFAEMNQPLATAVGHDRIVVSIGMFGRFWLVNEDAEAKVGVSRAGTEEETSLGLVGVTAFYEVCHQLVHECAERYYDPSQMPFNRSFQPFMVSRPVQKNGLRRWISYEDEESIQAKLDWMDSMKLTNVAIRHLDEDDFLGACYGQKYPLISKIVEWHRKKEINSGQFSNITKMPKDGESAFRVYRYRKLDSGDFFGTMPSTYKENNIDGNDHGIDWLEWETRNLIQIGKIGQGTFGCCYKMWNKKFDEILVKKVIDTRGTMVALAGDMNELRLHWEIKELKRSSRHNGTQNIIDFYGGYEFAREIVIFTEFMEFSLNRINSLGKPLREDCIGRIMVAVIRAMDFLWNSEPERRLLHRDIKPANILANKNGLVKLCDFGVSRICSSQTLAHGGQCTLVGSDGFIAPELLEGAPYSVQSDIFSLGQTLLQLATVHLAALEATMLAKDMHKFAKNNETMINKNNQKNYSKNLNWKRSAQFVEFLLGCMAWSCPHRFVLNTLIEHPFFVKQNEKWDDKNAHSTFCAWIRGQLRKEWRKKWRARISSTIHFYQRFFL